MQSLVERGDLSVFKSVSNLGFPHMALERRLCLSCFGT